MIFWRCWAFVATTRTSDQEMSNQVRILMISEDVPAPSMGGLGQHAVTLAKVLRRLGHQVDFMGNNKYPVREDLGLDGRFFQDLHYRFPGWKEEALGIFNPMRRSMQARVYAASIMRRAEHYDVLHYHGHVPDLAAFIPEDINFVQTRHDQGADCLKYTRFRDGRICITADPSACAGCAVKSPNVAQTMISSLAVRQHRRRVAKGFLRHKTIFVSDMLRRNFSRSSGSSNWGQVVHNFVDLEAIDHARKNPEQAFLGQTERPVLAIPGKLSPEKGVERFLVVAAEHKLVDRYRLLIIGDGPLEKKLRQSFEGLDVRFVGWCESKKTLSLLAGANSVVVPSVCEESCATTVFEGLFLGKVVHALNVGGTPELVKHAPLTDQLRLYGSMEELVAGLIDGFGRSPSLRSNERLWSAELAANQIIDIYAEPPRSLQR